MTKIVGFGDSFVLGTEIPDNWKGLMGWPALAARELGFDYETPAVNGCGNDHIARQIYSYFSSNETKNTLAVINWTWTQRWDFYITEKETWITLGPTCVPAKLQKTVDETQSHRLVEFYRDYGGKSILWNKVRSLQTIYAVQNFLNMLGVPSVQTFMDYHLFDETWHAPDYVKTLQGLVRKELVNFGDKNFVDWSHDNGFEVTVPGNHPLLLAHQAAADMWAPIYEAKVIV